MSLTRRFHIVFLAALLTLSALAVQAQTAPPHGRFYFGAGNNDYNSVIFESNLDSSNTVALTGYHNGYSMNYPSVSRDGSLVAFASNENADGHYHVWVMNADGSNRRQLTGPDLVEHFYDSDLYPAISPDGTKITFSSNRAVEFDGAHHTELYVINTDGTNLRQLTTSDPTLGPNSRNSINEVAWGPDSQTILFRGVVPWTDADGFDAKEGIYRIHSDGSGLQQIVGGYHVGFHTTFAIDWSHDGRYILYCNNFNGSATFVQVRDLQTNAETSFPMPSFAGNSGDCRFSPDGSRIAFSRRNATVDLLITDHSGNVLQSLPEAKFFTSYAGFNLNGDGFWWQDADPIPTPASLTFAPPTLYANLQQIVPVVPVLKDAAGNVLAQVDFDGVVTSIGGWSNYSAFPVYDSIFFRLNPYENGVQGNGITSGPYLFTAHNAGLSANRTIFWGQPHIEVRVADSQRFGDGTFRFKINPYDSGNARVTALSLGGVTLNGVSYPANTAFFADMGPGDAGVPGSTFFNFPAGALAHGQAGILKVTGTYLGGTFTTTLRVTGP